MRYVWVVLDGLALIAAGYAILVAAGYAWFGRVTPPDPEEKDNALDRLMPTYEVAERHQVEVNAPAAVTLATAKESDLQASALVRFIFWLRGLVMGAKPAAGTPTGGLVSQMTAIGWVVLDETPGREVVLGAVTKPWEANVVFRAVPPAEFAAFSEPGYVKIAWTLRADPAGAAGSVFRTETRVVSTDPGARARFRRYWAFVSPGVRLIRHLALAPLKAEAERRAPAGGPPPVLASS